MQNPSSGSLQTIRPQEKEYQTEIRTTYQNTTAQFNLAFEEREHEGTAYQWLVSCSILRKFDFLGEGRGSIISYDGLKPVVEKGRVYPLSAFPSQWTSTTCHNFYSPQKYHTLSLHHPHYQNKSTQSQLLSPKPFRQQIACHGNPPLRPTSRVDAGVEIDDYKVRLLCK